jgi:hypothetical protein
MKVQSSCYLGWAGSGWQTLAAIIWVWAQWCFYNMYSLTHWNLLGKCQKASRRASNGMQHIWGPLGVGDTVSLILSYRRISDGLLAPFVILRNFILSGLCFLPLCGQAEMYPSLLFVKVIACPSRVSGFKFNMELSTKKGFLSFLFTSFCFSFYIIFYDLKIHSLKNIYDLVFSIYCSWLKKGLDL